jgi:hypothetical protein
MAIKHVKGVPQKTGSVRKGFLKAPISGKETEDDLNRLEADVRMYKIEYEQFFGGGRARPPSDTEWRIEQTVKRYSDRGAEISYTHRFRFGNLVQAFTKYKEMFDKRMRKREEGRVDRHYGAAARAIQAEREATRPPAPPPSPVAPPSAPPPVAVRCSDPASEPNQVDQIYKAFRQALEYSGKPVDKLSPQAFEEFLCHKVEQLRKQKGGEVEVVVSVEDGKAILKARVKG